MSTILATPTAAAASRARPREIAVVAVVSNGCLTAQAGA
jgi:hypothetical protein